MARAFYRVPVAAWTAAPALAFVATELARVAGQVFVLAGADPCPELETAGATRLDLKLSRLLAAVRVHFAVTRVRRTMTIDSRAIVMEITVRASEVLGDDVIIEADAPRLVFAGDDPADYK